MDDLIYDEGDTLFLSKFGSRRLHENGQTLVAAAHDGPNPFLHVPM